MCLIIQAEPQFTISKELMAHFAKRNKDGFGVMWVENNKIQAKKFGPTEMDQLYPTYESLKHQNHFIHLRMRTHGDVNMDMAHPYYCGYGIWLMHNGVLTVDGDDESKSDTWHFINDIINPLFKMTNNPHNLIRSPVFTNLMKQYLGYSNRIVMGDRGGYVIFNNGQWHRINNEATGVVGMLVSNTYAWDASSYGKPIPVYTPSQTQARWRQRNLLNENDDEDTTTSNAEKEERFQKQIADLFCQIGRHWYINRDGKVFKRTGYGFRRRADLDDNDQFWNAFTHDKIVELSVWVAAHRQNDEVATEPPVVTPEQVTTPALLHQNWDNLPPGTPTAVATPTPTLSNKGFVVIDGHASILH